MINIELTNLEGKWVSRNIQVYKYFDDTELTIEIDNQSIEVTKKEKGKEPVIFASGLIKLKHLENDAFILEISELSTHNIIQICCKMFIAREKSSFIAKIEPYQERYFERI